jgi:hypothetical protein
LIMNVGMQVVLSCSEPVNSGEFRNLTTFSRITIL